jgi:F0F1-type ATP synthase epsilon subunit
MVLNFITPFKKLSREVAWVELDTNVGNFVIEPEHAPVILTLEKNSQVSYCLISGKQEKINVNSGIVHVTRSTVTILGEL